MANKFYMKKYYFATIFILSLFFIPSQVFGATFTENFDSLSTGNLDGQGGWTNTLTAANMVVTGTGALSAPNALTSFSTASSNSWHSVGTSTDFLICSISMVFFYLH